MAGNWKSGKIAEKTKVVKLDQHGFQHCVLLLSFLTTTSSPEASSQTIEHSSFLNSLQFLKHSLEWFLPRFSSEMLWVRHDLEERIWVQRMEVTKMDDN